MLQVKLIRCLDRYMDRNGIRELSAPAAAEVLDKAGLLKDSDTRPGKPLRDILRDGGFERYAYQIGREWHIRRSDIPAAKE